MSSAPSGAEIPTFLPRGRVLAGRWEIGEELGRGGSSVVYSALDRSGGGDVAVKLLVPPPASLNLARARMEREIEALRQLSHPGIVAILDVIDETAFPCLVMERVSGGDLAALVDSGGPLPPERAAAVAREVASALDFAHCRGILHRDVKPSNVLLDGSGHARLTDFGSAWIEGHSKLTQTGAYAGTPEFVAPEVVAGYRGDARSDVYALGLSLHFSLTGSLPRRSSVRGPLASAPEGHHPATLAPAIPQWLDAAVARATAADPGARFPTAAAFASALEAGAPIDGHRNRQVPSPRTSSSCRVCGGPDPIGLSPCFDCGASDGKGATVLLLVEPPTDPEKKRRLVADLGRMLRGATSRVAAEDAASGRRALARISPSEADRIEVRLRANEVFTVRTSQWGAARAVPFGFWALVGGVLAAGTAAGLLVEPALLLASPAVAVALSAAAVAAAGRPALRARRDNMPLDAPVRAAVLGVSRSLRPGPVRDLVLDIVGAARNLLTESERSGTEDRAPRLIRSVVESSCQAALEIDALDRSLERLDEHAGLATTDPRDWASTASRCSGARDILMHGLLQALASLESLRGERALRTDSAAGELVACANRLREETRRQTRVELELSAALGPEP